MSLSPPLAVIRNKRLPCSTINLLPRAFIFWRSSPSATSTFLTAIFS